MDLITNLQAQNEILKVKYSYNPNITSQMSKEEGAKKTTGWKLSEVDWSETSLKDLVREKSYIAAKLKEGRKKKENVEEVYFIVLDFDNIEKQTKTRKNKPFEYLSKEDFIEKAKKWQFSWFLHTTVSHKKKITDDLGVEKEGVDKFRVWIPLSKPISANDISGRVKCYFTERFPNVDPTCFQGDRYYFVSPKAEIHLNSFTSGDKLVFLNPDDIPEQDKVVSLGKAAVDEYFNKEQQLRLADGNTILKVKDIKVKTSIYCPWCIHDSVHRANPNSANAFIAINKAGQYYIHCSSENATYWQNPEEIDAESSNLFFNTNTGCPTAINYETDKGTVAYYVFKNDADFRNYCNHNDIDSAVKEFLPRRPVIFDPLRKSGLTERYYNIFEETEYMKKDYSILPRITHKDVLQALKSKTPVIWELMMNIFGESEALLRFLNWNAVILQRRTKVFTAWLISSEEQGVGKDFMFNFILRPIYGEKQSQLLNGNRIGQQFNSMDLNCFLRGYNEVFSSSEKAKNTSRKEWLKERITGSQHTIELKGVDATYEDNFMNFILFSNNDQPIFLDKKDRRYNVVNNKNAKKVKYLSFYVNRDDLVKKISSELCDFANIIFTMEAEIELADEAIETSAKRDLIEMSKDEYECFADALKNGDSSYFLLEEVFPESALDTALGQGVVRSDVARRVEETIRTRQFIPAKCMNSIIKYHFSKYNYREVLKKLKEKHITDKTIRDETGASIKAYVYELRSESVTHVTEL